MKNLIRRIRKISKKDLNTTENTKQQQIQKALKDIKGKKHQLVIIAGWDGKFEKAIDNQNVKGVQRFVDTNFHEAHSILTNSFLQAYKKNMLNMENATE